MYMGVDIGSTTSKVIILDEGGRIAGRAVVNAGTGTSGPAQAVKEAMFQAKITDAEIQKCIATGYGRMTFARADQQVTEITCHAKGVHSILPQVATIIDIGGQDAKVIRLNPQGKVDNFVMNEKCAAGTGRFLEVVARVLECPLEHLSDLAGQGKEGVSISSVCTVFAESEMISQLSEGKLPADVALGAHRSVAQRIAGLAGRIGIKPEVVMTGGAALNRNLANIVAETIEMELCDLEDPQLMGALGAAVIARERS